METVDDSVQTQLRVKQAQVFDVDQSQFLAFKVGKGGGAGAQAAGPTDRPVQQFLAAQNPRSLR